MTSLTVPPFDAPRGFRLNRVDRLNLGLIALFATALTILLWPQWLHNPDLSHGLFMPAVCLFLLYEARTSGHQRFLPATPVTVAATWAALAVGVVALALGGLYAAGFEWSHPIVALMLALSLASFMTAAWLNYASDRTRLIPFNWNALLAAWLWVLCAPIPPGTYTRLTLGLQLRISESVLGALHLLGIAAARQGNIIELATTSVGVEEACSGVRSLVSCVFAGFFFSGCIVRRPWARVVIIGVAAPLALAMNFLRSLMLTLLANAGIDITGKWHDATGLAVLGVTAILLGLLAVLLERHSKRPEGTPGKSRVLGATRPSPSDSTSRILAGGLVGALALAMAFGWHTRKPPASRQAAPDLEKIVPPSYADWHVITEADLNRFQDRLQTDHFVQRTYTRMAADGPIQITFYLAYWAPGQASASLVATHTPDACWPGSGWNPVPSESNHAHLDVDTHEIPEAEHRLFTREGSPQQVWFWHLYGHRPIPFLDPLSPRNVITIALRDGFRRAADQLFVRVSSNRRWADIAQEPLVRDIFARLQPLGL
jgi:exosortase